MSIDTPEELAGLKAAGAVVAEALREMERAVTPGISTGELDAIGAAVFARSGARSGPQLDYDFPGANCISVNDEAVHGIPGPRRLRDGDLVKLDVTAELAGFYADACVSVAVGTGNVHAAALAQTARLALADGLAAARAGAPLNAIGAAVQAAVSARGHAVCPNLMGHGIGRRIHEPPDVPNHFVKRLRQPLESGLVLTIEPIISAGSGAVASSDDGWTIRTADGALSAHFEHTVVITDGEPLILTVA